MDTNDRNNAAGSGSRLSLVQPTSLPEPQPLMEIIDEELWARDWSFRHLCELMGSGDQREVGIWKLALEMMRAVENDVNVIVDQKTADVLGRVFEVSPQLFINLHESWRDHLRKQTLCDDCHVENPVWFTSNEVWNTVIPGRVGVLCPICFIERAETAGLNTTGWKLMPEGELSNAG